MSGYLRPSRGVVRPQRGEARPTMLRSVNYGSTQSFAGGRVAVMPSFGRIKQFSVLGVAAAVVVGVAAPKASASNDVWLWACGGPGGTLKFDPSPTPPKEPGPFQWWTNGSGVVSFEGQPATTAAHDACDASGITLANAANSPGSSNANVQWGVPGGLSLKAVSATRNTHGF